MTDFEQQVADLARSDVVAGYVDGVFAQAMARRIVELEATVERVREAAGDYFMHGGLPFVNRTSILFALLPKEGRDDA